MVRLFLTRLSLSLLFFRLVAGRVLPCPSPRFPDRGKDHHCILEVCDHHLAPFEAQVAIRSLVRGGGFGHPIASHPILVAWAAAASHRTAPHRIASLRTDDGRPKCSNETKLRGGGVGFSLSASSPPLFSAPHYYHVIVRPGLSASSEEAQSHHRRRHRQGVTGKGAPLRT
ncbi:hypothetical protein B0J13DRAFT_42132 [Dactylonectria estremocensis]|uniref:Secreted protein n=1 Tax=Dactylonectria estremocensis TaxID=1079267 RepID=A0A9P9EUR7_9HYPO|nr:hypothetical protein B0J13DRAFT_42132 [Dactylonectria estremocensis]